MVEIGVIHSVLRKKRKKIQEEEEKPETTGDDDEDAAAAAAAATEAAAKAEAAAADSAEKATAASERINERVVTEWASALRGLLWLWLFVLMWLTSTCLHPTASNVRKSSLTGHEAKQVAIRWDPQFITSSWKQIPEHVPYLHQFPTNDATAAGLRCLRGLELFTWGHQGRFDFATSGRDGMCLVTSPWIKWIDSKRSRKAPMMMQRLWLMLNTLSNLSADSISWCQAPAICCEKGHPLKFQKEDRNHCTCDRHSMPQHGTAAMAWNMALLSVLRLLCHWFTAVVSFRAGVNLEVNRGKAHNFFHACLVPNTIVLRFLSQLGGSFLRPCDFDVCIACWAESNEAWTIGCWSEMQYQISSTFHWSMFWVSDPLLCALQAFWKVASQDTWSSDKRHKVRLHQSGAATTLSVFLWGSAGRKWKLYAEKLDVRRQRLVDILGCWGVATKHVLWKYLWKGIHRDWEMSAAPQVKKELKVPPWHQKSTNDDQFACDGLLGFVVSSMLRLAKVKLQGHQLYNQIPCAQVCRDSRCVFWRLSALEEREAASDAVSV